MHWHLWLDRTPRPGWQNMSLDMSLHARAARTGDGYLRIYRWDPACLSFGRHEPATRRYDRECIERLGLDTVRRPTGGRAVWHAGELTYAVAAPEVAMGSLREAYHRIHRTIVTALRSLGAGVQLAPPPQRAAPVDAGACFAAAAGGEVMLGTKKVVGSAQRRSGGVLLQHGSVLLDDDQSRVLELTRGVAPVPDVLPLSQILGRTAGWDEVALAISEAARPWGTRWRSIEHAGDLLAEAQALAPQFRDPAWTWQR